MLEKAVDIPRTEALGRPKAIVVHEILYPEVVGLLCPFTVSQPVNSKGNAVNQMLT